MRYVIAGNGVAGTSAAAKIRDLDKTGEIDIFTDEPYPFYSRPLLPEFIAGAVEEKNLFVHPPQWYEDKNIVLHLEEGVEAVRPGEQELTTAEGKYKYDRLLLAAGSNPFVPPVKGMEDKEGIFTLRSIDDAKAIKEYAKKSRKAVLIGGGLLGLEAGNGLRRAGLQVVVVESFPRLLPRQLDSEGAAILQRRMEEMGFEFFLDQTCEEIQGQGKVEGILLKSERRVDADMILVSAGVRSDLRLANSTGMETERGVIVNDRLETSIENIFAAGDVAQHRGLCYGIWPASQRQGEVAGTNMAGGDETYDGTVPSNSLKVLGIDLVSSGEIDAEGKLECRVATDPEGATYRKLVFDGECLVGCVLLGDVKGRWELLRAIETRKDITEFKEDLLSDDFDFAAIR